MKTRTSTIVKKIIIVTILSILVNVAFAQHRQYGRQESWSLKSVNYNVGYVGNGLSFNNEIGLTAGTSTNNVNISILTTPRPLKIIGAMVNYQYYLLPAEESTNIYISVLGEIKIKSALTDELNVLMHEKDFKGEYEKFNTIDLGAGFGIKQNLFLGLSINAAIHLDYYKRQIASAQDLRTVDFARYSEDTGFVLNLKLGVTYDF